MAKFCSKCGTKLNEKTGKCPNCDEKTKMDLSNSDGANSTNVNSKNDETMKKNSGEQKKEKKKTKKIVAIIIVVTVALILIAAGIIGLVLYLSLIHI